MATRVPQLSPAASAVLDALNALPATERNAVLQAVTPASGPGWIAQPDAELAAELHRRLDRLAANPQDVVPWEQVRQSLVKRP